MYIENVNAIVMKYETTVKKFISMMSARDQNFK